MTRFPTRILVAVDHSAVSRRAVEAAADLALATGSELHLLHVKSTSSTVAGRPVTAGLGQRMEADAAELLAAASESIVVRGAQVTATHVRFGEHVSRTIAEAQDELEAGLLVVGASGGGSVARSLLADSGSRLVRRTSGSVLVVRGDPDAAA
jgi:nucleotide-binding universal stress UspA family protein